MSYDVYTDDGAVDWNYTSNCAPMWRAAGADLAEFDTKRAADCATILGHALVAMISEPAKYEAMNPPNAWGSYESVVPALFELWCKLRANPDAIVNVSR